MNTSKITIADIESLRDEAQDAGDWKTSDICDAALAGNVSAIAECARIIAVR
jgi:hypothetical protein